jgi:hypothetical protein
MKLPDYRLVRSVAIGFKIYSTDTAKGDFVISSTIKFSEIKYIHDPIFETPMPSNKMDGYFQFSKNCFLFMAMLLYESRLFHLRWL